MKITRNATFVTCYHCGDPCRNKVVTHHDHEFCCEGCAAVFDLLQDKDLCAYYEIEEKPGNAPINSQREKWAILDEPEIEKSLLQYRSADLAITTLHIPGLHCTSCIYLLENLC